MSEYIISALVTVFVFAVAYVVAHFWANAEMRKIHKEIDEQMDAQLDYEHNVWLAAIGFDAGDVTENPTPPDTNITP